MLYQNSVRASVELVSDKVIVSKEDGITDVEIRIGDSNGNVAKVSECELAIPVEFVYPIRIDVSVWGEPFGFTQGNHSEAHAEVKAQLKDRWMFSACRHMKGDDVVESEGVAQGMVRAAQMLGFKAEQYCTLMGAVSYCEVEDQNDEVWKVVVWEEDGEYVSVPANYHFQNLPPEYADEDEDDDAYLGAKPSVFANAAKAAMPPCVDPVAQFEMYPED